jgi:hypothetical protein
VGFRINSTTFTGDRPWTPNHSKTTKFIQSKPIVTFDGEPPF